MAFKLQSAYAVAAGVFNIHVVQPEFLHEIGVVSKDGGRIQVFADLVQPGFRYRSQPPVVIWQMRPDRLIIAPEDPSVNAGEMLAKVLDALKWTPLIGVNTTVEFESDDSILKQLGNRCKLPDIDAVDGYTMGATACHINFVRGEHRFTFQISRDGRSTDDNLARIKLQVSIHTEIAITMHQLQANKLAQNACKKYKEFFDDVLTLTKKVLNVEAHL